MKVGSVSALVWLALGCVAAHGQDWSQKDEGAIRFATFNASLNRDAPGKLAKDLATSDDPQARNVAEIIQRVRPDVLLVNEFDYDEAGKSVDLFRRNYLAKGWNGAKAVDYPYAYSAPVNTGVASGVDLDGDGKAATEPGSRGYGNDAIGFGLFPGQYGMVVYSRYPIGAAVKRFDRVLWKAMPGALLPTKMDGSPWYSVEALKVLRLSSKGHWDVPLTIAGKDVHVLASHPTPPAFDGPEDRNGKRNHDEVRLWSDYLKGGPASSYLGEPGKTPPKTFVLMGDMNADPVDGGSVPGAIEQLLKHPAIGTNPTPTSLGAAEASTLQGKANTKHKGNPAEDTADFSDDQVGNLRADYVLASIDLQVVGAGVFWPKAGDPLARLVVMSPTAASSDHRLVYVDVKQP